MLINKIREEQQKIASAKAIELAEKTAKNLEVKSQLAALTNLELGEWFLTEVKIGNKWAQRTCYEDLVNKKTCEFELDRLFVAKEKRADTNIATLVYNSNPKDGYVTDRTIYANNGEFEYCLGEVLVNRILMGIKEMGIKITTEMRKSTACNQDDFEVTVLTMD